MACAARSITSSPRSRETQEPDQFSLSRLRFAYAQAVAAGTLSAREDGGFGLDWREDEPRRVRFAVAADAVALLADPARLARLHRCPGAPAGGSSST